MTVRAMYADAFTVYAGTADELAAVAEEYAAGTRPRPPRHHADLFKRTAALLRTGEYPAIDLGDVRFYRDHASGRPFAGPFAPKAHEAWERQQELLGALSRR